MDYGPAPSLEGVVHEHVILSCDVEPILRGYLEKSATVATSQTPMKVALFWILNPDERFELRSPFLSLLRFLLKLVLQVGEISYIISTETFRF